MISSGPEYCPFLPQPLWTTTGRWIAFSPWVISSPTLSSISLTRLRLSTLRRNCARVLGLGSLPLSWVKAAEAERKWLRNGRSRENSYGRGPGPRARPIHKISSLLSMDDFGGTSLTLPAPMAPRISRHSRATVGLDRVAPAGMNRGGCSDLSHLIDTSPAMVLQSALRKHRSTFLSCSAMPDERDFRCSNWCCNWEMREYDGYG